MTEPDVRADPLAGWDPRRRTALERLWARFETAGARQRNLSEELVAERREQAALEDAQLVADDRS